LGKEVIIDIGVHIQNPQYVSIDDNTWIDKYVILIAGPPSGERETVYRQNPNYRLGRGELSIGKNVHIAPFCIISGMGGVMIGDNVGLSTGCKVYSFSHHYRSFKDPSNSSIAFSPMVERECQAMLLGPVVFENNTGMALNCVVLPGVTVGQNSFVMINSVVTKDVPPNSLVAGYPARVVGQRFELNLDSSGRG